MTKIFKDYSEFVSREDKKLNGVSPEFAEVHDDFVEDNENNEGCWDCSRCSLCTNCSHCLDCFGCSGCLGCSYCFGCSDCSDCFGCSDCSHCIDCSYCSHCSRCSLCSHTAYFDTGKNITAKPGKGEQAPIMGNYPILENIHQKVYDAASSKDALDMSSWHTQCGTTHCRAGWVVHLAGEAGRELEEHTSTLFAALQIYKASSPIEVSPVRFFDDNQSTLDNMKECAEKESQLPTAVRPGIHTG